MSENELAILCITMVLIVGIQAYLGRARHVKPATILDLMKNTITIFVQLIIAKKITEKKEDDKSI